MLEMSEWCSNAFLMDMFRKSHNASVSYPTMHHFVTEMCTCAHFCHKMVHCGISYVLLHSWDGSIVIMLSCILCYVFVGVIASDNVIMKNSTAISCYMYNNNSTAVTQNEVMTWKHFPHNWHFAMGHWWFPFTKGHLCRAFISHLILVWTALNKQSSCQWFETPWCSCDVTVIKGGAQTLNWRKTLYLNLTVMGNVSKLCWPVNEPS